MSAVDAPTAGSRFVGKVDTTATGPAMQLDGIPASVHWQRVADFLTSLGIDLRQIPAQNSDEEQPGVVIGWQSIRCRIYATNAQGQRYLDLNTGEIAVHTVHIPVVHDA